MLVLLVVARLLQGVAPGVGDIGVEGGVGVGGVVLVVLVVDTAARGGTCSQHGVCSMPCTPPLHAALQGGGHHCMPPTAG